MADQRTLNLLNASYKGFEFLVKEENKTGGPRIIKHEYPNSNTRFIERNGTIQDDITVSAFIHGPNWLQDTDAFKEVLDSDGPGTLILPHFGTIQNVYSGTYSIRASHTSIGIIIFDLNFSLSRPSAGPVRGPAIQFDVADAADSWRLLAALNVQQLFLIAKDAATLISSATDLKTLTSTALDLLSRYVDTGPLSNVLAISSRIINNPGSLVVDSFELALALFGIESGNTGLWTSFAANIPDGSGLDAALQLTSIGAGTDLDNEDINGSNVLNDTINNPAISLWPETTFLRTLRNRNRLTMVNSFRVSALVLAYQQAAEKTFNTASEIRVVRESLEEAYTRLMKVSVKDTESFQSDADTIQGLNNVRTLSLSVLDQKEQNANRITTYSNVAPTTAFNLAYKLYAESIQSVDDLETRAITIRNLNLKQPATSLNGTVTVLRK